MLVIDYNVTPPTYYGGGASSWPATLTCPPNPTPVPITMTGLYLAGSGAPTGQAAAGTVSGNGSVIEGTDTIGGSNTFKWRFTRNP